MAGSSVQGYVRVLNLEESEDDRQALNNLGGAPIADDIALFVNNTRNRSTLRIKQNEYNETTGEITLDNQTREEINTRSSVYTEGDKVFITDLDNNLIQDELFVKESNTIDRFFLTANQDLTGVFTFSPTTDFLIIRPDTVTLDNLINLGLERTSVISAGGGSEGGGSDDDEEASVLDDIGNFNDTFENIFITLDTAVFQSQSKYVATENKFTDRKISVEGNIIIADPGNTIINEGITSTSPGLYLSDPTSSVDNIQKVRAFSSNSDPWVDDQSGTLSTQSTDVTAGNLTLTQGIKINNLNTNSASGIVDANTFTHKILVRIDGIDYYLCLSS
jgi:hypothetical protein